MFNYRIPAVTKIAYLFFQIKVYYVNEILNFMIGLGENIELD